MKVDGHNPAGEIGRGLVQGITKESAQRYLQWDIDTFFDALGEESGENEDPKAQQTEMLAESEIDLTCRPCTDVQSGNQVC